MSVTFQAGREFNDPKFGKVRSGIPELEEFEVNLANTNARLVLSLIDIRESEDGLIGSFSINDLRIIVDKVDNPSFMQQPYWGKGKKGAKVIYMGRSLDQLRGYSDRFSKLADAAEKQEAEFILYG